MVAKKLQHENRDGFYLAAKTVSDSLSTDWEPYERRVAKLCAPFLTGKQPTPEGAAATLIDILGQMGRVKREEIYPSLQVITKFLGLEKLLDSDFCNLRTGRHWAVKKEATKNNPKYTIKLADEGQWDVTFNQLIEKWPWLRNETALASRISRGGGVTHISRDDRVYVIWRYGKKPPEQPVLSPEKKVIRGHRPHGYNPETGEFD